MAEIVSYSVLRPPTSEEVAQLALSALRYNSEMVINVKGMQDVPMPSSEEVSFRINCTTHTEQGDMIIAGQTTDGRSVVVTAPRDSATAALAEIVRG